MITVKDVLVKARGYIATPDTWTKGASARVAYGTNTWPTNPYATCFCPLGAISKAVAVLNAADGLFDSAADLLSDVVAMNTAGWNDQEERTHEEVVAAFDKAIEECK